MYDEEILKVKIGPQVPDEIGATLGPEELSEEIRRVCSLRYLDGYLDTKVIAPMPLPEGDAPASMNARLKSHN